MAKFADFEVGKVDSIRKTITDSDIVMFAGVTGDFNPVHIDDVSAKDSMFKKRIAHGMISAGLISAVLGTKLPGPGTIYLSQTLKFRRPVFIGDTITAKVEVVEKNDEKKQLRLKTECSNQEDVVVTSGEALVTFSGN